MKHQKTVCVIGLGYVGLPLAMQAVKKGYKVYGLEKNAEKNELINAGKSPIEDAKAKFAEDLPLYHPEATTDEKVITKSDIVLICVPTPVDKNFYPVLDPVIVACESIARNLKRGALVVLESTVNPGVSEEVMAPIFEKAGFKVGTDVFIAHCPERIDPGASDWSKGWTMINTPRVVGSFEEKGLSMAVEFYQSILEGEIHPMKSIREAEAVKIVENSFRAINIAFVNELAKSFEKLNIDVKDVIDGAATKPYAFMAHYPSCGVGGHCIPVDPYYLMEKARGSGFDHQFLKRAMEMNNSMTEYTVELLQDALNEVKLPMNGTKIGVLGLSYKPNIDDMRNSPATKIIKHAKKYLAEVITFDPHVLGKSSVKSLAELLEQSDAIVLATDHKEFLETLTPELLKQYDIKVVIDGKNRLDKKGIVAQGIVYKGIGR